MGDEEGARGVVEGLGVVIINASSSKSENFFISYFPPAHAGV